MTLFFVLLCFFNHQEDYKPAFSVEKEKTKNKVERCILKEVGKCVAKRQVCGFYEDMSKEECKIMFDKCLKKSIIRCKVKYGGQDETDKD